MSTTWDDEKADLFGDEEEYLKKRWPEPGAELSKEVMDKNIRARGRSIHKGLKGELLVKRGRRLLSRKDTADLTTKLSSMYLSPEVRDDRSLTNSDLRILAILVMGARRSGTLFNEMSVPEIANRAAVSHRQVQLTVNKVSSDIYGFLDRTMRPVRSCMNDTNVYKLAEKCFRLPLEEKVAEKRENLGAPLGEKQFGVNNKPSRFIKNTSTETTSKKVGCRKSRPFRNRLGEISSYPPQRPKLPLPVPKVSFTEGQAILAKRALALLKPRTPPPDDLEVMITMIERLRVEKISAFDDGWWPHCVRRHGANAYLAVVQTELFAHVRADCENFIHTKAGYLGGILKKKPEEANPAHSINEIVQHFSKWLPNVSEYTSSSY